jgi:hypothetical protein
MCHDKRDRLPGRDDADPQQVWTALNKHSCDVIREYLADVAVHTSRTWVVADYEADPHLPWRRHLILG